MELPQEHRPSAASSPASEAGLAPEERLDQGLVVDLEGLAAEHLRYRS